MCSRPPIVTCERPGASHLADDATLDVRAVPSHPDVIGYPLRHLFYSQPVGPGSRRVNVVPYTRRRVNNIEVYLPW